MFLTWIVCSSFIIWNWIDISLFLQSCAFSIICFAFIFSLESTKNGSVYRHHKAYCTTIGSIDIIWPESMCAVVINISLRIITKNYRVYWLQRQMRRQQTRIVILAKENWLKFYCHITRTIPIRTADTDTLAHSTIHKQTNTHTQCTT